MTPISNPPQQQQQYNHNNQNHHHHYDHDQEASTACLKTQDTQSNTPSFIHHKDKFSIYDKIGGEAAIEIAVNLFTLKVLEDPLVSCYFADSNMYRVGLHLKWFFCSMFGGPVVYKGKTLKEAHEGLGIKEAHFLAIVNHFCDTLKELGLDNITNQDVFNSLMALRYEIL